jgi:hypothetical protein
MIAAYPNGVSRGEWRSLIIPPWFCSEFLKMSSRDFKVALSTQPYVTPAHAEIQKNQYASKR